MEHKSATVLVVDDEETIRRLVAAKLSTEGYRCLQAENTDAATACLQDETVDAVILDIRMPGKSGIDFLPEIKSLSPDTAVVMATAVTETGTAIRCMRQGADDYVTKPFNLGEVTVGVRRALEKRRLQLEIKEAQCSLENRVDEQTARIRQLFLGAIESLVAALEAKDHYTSGHSRRVAELAVKIGREMGLPESDIEDLHWGGLLHDVGKIAVDQLVQNKRGKLTPDEYEHVMIHAHVGAGIVKPVVNEKVVGMIEHHHDHYDGKGLHQSVAGIDIPLSARILAVADAFDAMTSERPYRPAMSVKDAVTETRKSVGTHLDPVVTKAFLRTIGVEPRPRSIKKKAWR